jgi:uncharacterized protein YqhQ
MDHRYRIGIRKSKDDVVPVLQNAAKKRQNENSRYSMLHMNSIVLEPTVSILFSTRIFTHVYMYLHNFFNNILHIRLSQQVQCSIFDTQQLDLS